MDLIVSTAQGEAEISVTSVHESVTVGDLLGRVLNSAPPALVYIDGRPTPTGTLVSAAGLVIGSVIEVGTPLERAGDDRRHPGAGGRRGCRQPPTARTRPLHARHRPSGQRRAADVQPGAGAAVRGRRRALRHRDGDGESRRPGWPCGDQPVALGAATATDRSSCFPARRADSRSRGLAAADQPRPTQLRQGSPRRGGSRPGAERSGTSQRSTGADKALEPRRGGPADGGRTCRSTEGRIRRRARQHQANPPRPRRGRPPGNAAVRPPVGASPCRRRRVHLQRGSGRPALGARQPTGDRSSRPHAAAFGTGVGRPRQSARHRFREHTATGTRRGTSTGDAGLCGAQPGRSRCRRALHADGSVALGVGQVAAARSRFARRAAAERRGSHHRLGQRPAHADDRRGVHPVARPADHAQQTDVGCHRRSSAVAGARGHAARVVRRGAAPGSIRRDHRPRRRRAGGVHHRRSHRGQRSSRSRLSDQRAHRHRRGSVRARARRRRCRGAQVEPARRPHRATVDACRAAGCGVVGVTDRPGWDRGRTHRRALAHRPFRSSSARRRRIGRNRACRTRPRRRWAAHPGRGCGSLGQVGSPAHHHRLVGSYQRSLDGQRDVRRARRWFVVRSLRGSRASRGLGRQVRRTWRCAAAARAAVGGQLALTPVVRPSCGQPGRLPRGAVAEHRPRREGVGRQPF